jgi:TRAP-type C4-dicarboxylate transport system substrate-binding protein
MEGVKKVTEGRVTMSFNGPEAVPPFEQLEPVGAGVFHFLFTHGAYHLGTTPVATVADAIVATPDEVHSSGLFDYFDKHYQQFGLKLVVLPVTPVGAYHIYTREPVSANGDLAGRKLRGSPTYTPIFDLLGGVLVVLPASEVYTALDSGLIDGGAWPAVGVLDYKWYEVADYLLRPAFGVNYEPIFMNLDAWNNLSPEDQKAILDFGKELEKSWYDVAPKIWQREEQALIEKGMKITEMGDEQKAKLAKAWSDGLWVLGAGQNAAVTEDFRAFAESKGLKD